MIRILYMNVNMLKDADLYQKGMNMVSSERKEKINQMKNPVPARLSLGAGILLRIALEEKGYAHLIEDICYGKNGKPFLKDVDFHFNLSHSGAYAVCAYGDQPIGIDLQIIKEVFLPAFEELRDCLQMTTYIISKIQVNEHILDDQRYDLMFSVEEVNRRATAGTPFRDAYKQVGLEIEAGNFTPDKDVRHTHEGSIGNLCNDRIAALMNDILKDFRFERMTQAEQQLING